MISTNSNEAIFKKFDSLIIKVEEESAEAHRSPEEVEKDLRNRYE